jgi:8-oxo-dGTP pyrophosphatase MutT (NUDIX family)
VPDPDLADRPEAWPVVASRDLHRGDWVVALRSDRIRHPDQPDGETFNRIILEHPGAVVVLAIDDEDRAICLSQYRHAARQRFVELPAGVIDADEEPLEVGRRELREETGLEAGEWTPLLSTYSSPGYSAEVIHYFLARELREVGRGDFVLTHEEADMQLFRVAYADLLGAVLSGAVRDAPVALAVLAAEARGLAPGGRTARE